MPDGLSVRPERAERPGGIAVVVRTGKDDDGDPWPNAHAARRARSRSSRSAGSRAVARTCSSSARASSGLVACNSRSTSRPTRAPLTAKPSGLQGKPVSASPADRGCPPGPDQHGRLHRSDHLRVGEVGSNLDLRESLERFHIAGPCARDDLGRQLGSRRCLVPVDALAVVTDELLVVRGLRPPGVYASAAQSGTSPASAPRRRARGRRRQDESELELRVSEEDAARLGVGGREAVEKDRRCRHLVVEVWADEGRGRLRVDVLVGPDAAFVAGVTIGWARRSDSWSPGGRRWPQTEPVRR